FVRVTDRAGKTLVHAADARDAVAIDLHFADGRGVAHVGDGAAPPPARAARTLVRAADARAAVAIDLHFADGRVAAHVGDGTAPQPFRPAKRVERRASDPYLPKQPGLFDSEE